MFKSRSSFNPRGKGGMMARVAQAAGAPQRSGFGIAKTMGAGLGKAMARAAGAKPPMMKKGGYVKAADGCAQRGKTKGRMV